MEVKELGNCWIAWSNTDLSEGRGVEYPKYVCKIEATAKRLSKKLSVMGCDGAVTELPLISVYIPGKGSRMYGPIYLQAATQEDFLEQKRLDEAARLKNEKQELIDRLIASGAATAEELAILK